MCFKKLIDLDDSEKQDVTEIHFLKGWKSKQNIAVKDDQKMIELLEHLSCLYDFRFQSSEFFSLNFLPMHLRGWSSRILPNFMLTEGGLGKSDVIFFQQIDIV